MKFLLLLINLSFAFGKICVFENFLKISFCLRSETDSLSFKEGTTATSASPSHGWLHVEAKTNVSMVKARKCPLAIADPRRVVAKSRK